jgi:hypothetical protein
MAEDEFHIVDDVGEPPEPDAPEAPAARARAHAQAELDGVRIRRLAAARRALYRQRSYCIVAAGFCAVAAGELAWTAIALFSAAGWRLRPGAYLLLAMGSTFAAIDFARRAVRLHRLAGRSALPEPAAPPDFSPLGDGSQRWRNLEEM